MKATLALRLIAPILAITALIGARAPYAVMQNGVERFPFESDAPVSIPCAPNFACMIALESGEVVSDVVAGGSVKRDPQGGWVIAQGSQGATPIVYVTPMLASSKSTNLIVTTNRRKYTVLLVAVPTVSRWSYGFLYPVAARSSMTAVAVPSPTPAPAPARDFDWLSRGRTAFTPVNPYSIGETLYLPLPKGALVPSIVYANGQRMEPVAHTFDPETNTIIVLNVRDKITLYLGEGKDMQIATVERAPVVPAGALR